MEELTYQGRKRVHNLKYYTWVEQQGRTVDELNDLWYDEEKTWKGVHGQAEALDDPETLLPRPRAHVERLMPMDFHCNQSFL